MQIRLWHILLVIVVLVAIIAVLVMRNRALAKRVEVHEEELSIVDPYHEAPPCATGACPRREPVAPRPPAAPKPEPETAPAVPVPAPAEPAPAPAEPAPAPQPRSVVSEPPPPFPYAVDAEVGGEVVLAGDMAGLQEQLTRMAAKAMNVATTAEPPAPPAVTPADQLKIEQQQAAAQLQAMAEAEAAEAAAAQLPEDDDAAATTSFSEPPSEPASDLPPMLGEAAEEMDSAPAEPARRSSRRKRLRGPNEE